MPPRARLHLVGLFLYPVKSLRGLAVSHVALDSLGIVGDRRFLVVDLDGKFLTQRTHPRMALVDTAMLDDRLVLSASGHGKVAVGLRSDPAAIPRSVSVWSSVGLSAEDCGEPAATWLSTFLGHPCRLVRAGRAFHRPVAKPGRSLPDDVVGFADAYPLLVVGEESLADLNDRLVAQGEEPVPMDRFRPNLVVRGAGPFAEDRWRRFRVGDIVLRVAGPCARCVITTTDQQTAVRGVEPLRTLATYRRDAGARGDVNFGQNVIHETKAGELATGTAIEVIDEG